MKAGSILGTPGKTGKVYDTCVPNDKDTLCYFLNNTKIDSIIGYDFDLKKHKLDPKHFVEIVNSSKNIVTKEYYSDVEDFTDELKSINKIYSYFGKSIDKYTTLGDVIKYKNKNIIGCIISYGEKKLYVTFQGKCGMRFREYVLKTKLNKETIVLFLKNVVDTLIILQKNNIAHCDIKFDNIMLKCSNGDFKLIDWNLSKSLTYKNVSKLKKLKPYLRGSSPVYYGVHFWIHWIFYINNYLNDCMLINHEKDDILRDECVNYAKMCYNNFYEKILPSFKNGRDMFEHFKFTTDLWSLGLMLFYISKKNNISELIPLADILCLLEKSPITGAYIKNANDLLNLLEYNINNTGCGIINGIGAHGMLIDLCCDVSNDSLKQNVLCKHLDTLYKNNSIKSIKIYTPDEITIRNIEYFINFIKNTGNNIAVKYYYKPDIARQDMMDDIMNTIAVNNLYKGHESMLVSCDMKYQNHTLLGLSVEQNNITQYYYFSKKCSKTLDKLENVDKNDINKIIKDTLDSLIVLHSNEYYHGDIKAQNIMLCQDGKYKLIDWGRLYPIYKYNKNYKYGGSMQSGTPLGLYFMIRNKSRNTISRSLATQMALLLFEGKLPFISAKCPLLIDPILRKKFNKLWSDIKYNFVNCIEQTKNDEELFNRYKYTLDTYNFALTLLYILLKSNINNNKYFSIIRKMTLYNDDMITNATDALSQFIINR